MGSGDICLEESTGLGLFDLVSVTGVSSGTSCLFSPGFHVFME